METELLFNELADLGVCASGRRLWRKSSRDESMIIKVWKRWPEFWVEHSDKALDIVRRYFSSETDLAQLEDNRIYLDRNINVVLGSENQVFVVGSSNIDILVKDWSVLKIYCFNDSNLNISCGYHSYVNIECYDNSHLNILSNTGKCKIYSYDKSIIDNKCVGNTDVVKMSVKRGQVFNGSEFDHTN